MPTSCQHRRRPPRASSVGRERDIQRESANTATTATAASASGSSATPVVSPASAVAAASPVPANRRSSTLADVTLLQAGTNEERPAQTAAAASSGSAGAKRKSAAAISDDAALSDEDKSTPTEAADETRTADEHAAKKQRAAGGAAAAAAAAPSSSAAAAASSSSSAASTSFASSSAAAAAAAPSCAASSLPAGTSSSDAADSWMIDDDAGLTASPAAAAASSAYSSSAAAAAPAAAASSSSSALSSAVTGSARSSCVQSAVSLLFAYLRFQRGASRRDREQQRLFEAHLTSVRECVTSVAHRPMAAGMHQFPVRVLSDLLLSALYMIDAGFKPLCPAEDLSVARLWLLKADAVAAQIAASLPADFPPSDRSTLIDLSVRAGMFPLLPSLIGASGEFAPTQFGEPYLVYLLTDADEHLIDLTPVLGLFALGLDPTVQTGESLSSLDHARALMPLHWRPLRQDHPACLPLLGPLESLVPRYATQHRDEDGRDRHRRADLHSAFVHAVIPAWQRHSLAVHSCLLAAAPDRLIPDLVSIVAAYLDLDCPVTDDDDEDDEDDDED